MRGFLLTFRYLLPESGCLIMAKLKGGKKSVVSRGLARIFSKGTHSFFKSLSTATPLSNLEAIVSYFIHHKPDGYVVCFGLVGTNLNRWP